MLTQAFELMLIGMAVVFVFLTLLIVCTRLMSALAVSLTVSQSRELAGLASQSISQSTNQTEKSPRRTAAMIAAVLHHNKRRP